MQGQQTLEIELAGLQKIINDKQDKLGTEIEAHNRDNVKTLQLEIKKLQDEYNDVLFRFHVFGELPFHNEETLEGEKETTSSQTSNGSSQTREYIPPSTPLASQKSKKPVEIFQTPRHISESEFRQMVTSTSEYIVNPDDISMNRSEEIEEENQENSRETTPVSSQSKSSVSIEILSDSDEGESFSKDNNLDITCGGIGESVGFIDSMEIDTPQRNTSIIRGSQIILNEDKEKIFAEIKSQEQKWKAELARLEQQTNQLLAEQKRILLDKLTNTSIDLTSAQNQSSVDEIQNKIKSHSSKLKDANEKFVQLGEKVKEFGNTKKDLNGRIDDLVASIDELVGNRGDLESRLTELEKENNTIERVGEAKETFSNHVKTVEKNIKTELDDVIFKVENIEKDIEDFKSQIQDLNRHEKMDEGIVKEQDFYLLRDKVEQYELKWEEFEVEKTTLCKTVEETANSLSECLEGIAQLAESSRPSVEDVKTEVAKYVKDTYVKKIRKDIAGLRDTVFKELSVKVDEVVQESSDVKTFVSSSGDKLDELESKVTKIVDDFVDVQTFIKDHEDLKEQLEKKMEKQVKKMKKTIESSSSASFEEITGKVTELETKVAGVVKANSKLNKKFNNQKGGSNSKEVVDKLQELEKLVGENETKRETLESTIDGKLAVVRKSLKTLKQKSNAIDQLSSSSAEMEENMKSWKLDIENKLEGREGSTGENTEKSVGELKTKISSLKKETKTMKDLINTLKSENEKLVESLDKKLTDETSKWDSVQKENEKLQQTVSKLKQKNKQTEQSLKQEIYADILVKFESWAAEFSKQHTIAVDPILSSGETTSPRKTPTKRKRDDQSVEPSPTSTAAPKSDTKSPAKRQKTRSKKVIYFSGFKESDLTSAKKKEYCDQVVALGGEVWSGAEFISKITHVITPAGTRTMKTLAAALTGRWLISLDWISSSATAGSWLPETQFGVKYSDRPFEGKKFFTADSYTHGEKTKEAQQKTANTTKLVKHLGKGEFVLALDQADFCLVGPEHNFKELPVPDTCKPLTWVDFVAMIPGPKGADKKDATAAVTGSKKRKAKGSMLGKRTKKPTAGSTS